MLKNPHSKISPASYGGVVVSTGKDGQRRVLLQQRRDSYAYTGFLCGDYPSEEYLPKYFNLMTEEEKDRLFYYYQDFDALWEDLFIRTERRAMRNMYPFAKETFERIKHQIPFYVELSESSIDLPWAFPTGRLKKHGDIERTIISEIEEETRVRVAKENFVPGIEFNRTIMGSDDRTYSYKYYLAQLDRLIEVPNVYTDTPNGIREKCFTDETNCAKWVTFDEARYMVDESLQEVLTEVEYYELFPVDLSDLLDVVDLIRG